MFCDRSSFCTSEYHNRGEFLFDMAMKSARTTVRDARNIAVESDSSDGQSEQYESLLQGLHDSLE